MKIYNGLDEFKKLDFAIVTSGTFDGVHFGHQKILERLHEITKKNGGEVFSMFTVMLPFLMTGLQYSRKHATRPKFTTSHHHMTLKL